MSWKCDSSHSDYCSDLPVRPHAVVRLIRNRPTIITIKTRSWRCDGSCRGLVEAQTLTDTQCVRVSIPADPPWEGRGELNSPVGAVLAQDGEASGRDPEVLHIIIGGYQLHTENTLPPVALTLERLASVPALFRHWPNAPPNGRSSSDWSDAETENGTGTGDAHDDPPSGIMSLTRPARHGRSSPLPRRPSSRPTPRARRRRVRQSAQRPPRRRRVLRVWPRRPRPTRRARSRTW